MKKLLLSLLMFGNASCVNFNELSTYLDAYTKSVNLNNIQSQLNGASNFVANLTEVAHILSLGDELINNNNQNQNIRIIKALEYKATQLQRLINEARYINDLLQNPGISKIRNTLLLTRKITEILLYIKNWRAFTPEARF